MSEQQDNTQTAQESANAPTRKPWHTPVMEVLPVSQSENFITTHSDSVASANS